MFYVKKEEKKACRCKQMKDKTRITLMVALSADGAKCVLLGVGKPKEPRCFDLVDPPFPYRSQKNA